MSTYPGRSFRRNTALPLLALSMILLAGCATVVKSGTFRSRYYGYSVALPAGWSGTKAQDQWGSGSSFPGFEDPDIDLFSGPSSVRAFAVGQTWPGSLAAYIRMTLQAQAAAHQCPVAASSNQPITISGSPARLLGMSCQGLQLEIAITVHARNGLVFTCDLASATGADRAAVRRLLAGIRLKP